MAIITDATGRQLAQAVGGIDTTGLVKDSTVQATNTALGNINTTEQSIATAINGLGQLLGNDKANIDGSNIVNPSVFRTNIEASKVSINEYSVTDTTNAQGFIVTGYEFNKYLLSAKVLDNSTNFIRYSLFRASQQNKVVVMCLDDNMNGVANTSVTVTLRYLQID